MSVLEQKRQNHDILWMDTEEGIWLAALACRHGSVSLIIEEVGNSGPYMEFMCPSDSDDYTFAGMSDTLKEAKEHLLKQAKETGDKEINHAFGESALHV